jgi:hypothetical protein
VTLSSLVDSHFSSLKREKGNDEEKLLSTMKDERVTSPHSPPYPLSPRLVYREEVTLPSSMVESHFSLSSLPPPLYSRVCSSLPPPLLSS